MKRNTVAVAAGIVLAFGSATVITAEAGFSSTSLTTMLQGQVASRWQADRFGPIVSSDTLWSIAMYYSDRTDLTVYEMMDLIVELNPKVFINGRPDRMMDGYYLKIPQQAQQAMVAAKLAEAEALEQSAPQPAVNEQNAASETPAATSSAAEAAPSVQFDVNELQQLRQQLAESITLIERLNNENGELQQRLNDVSADLNELKLKVNAEQKAESELKDRIQAEITAVKTEPQASPAEVESQAQTNAEPAQQAAAAPAQVTSTPTKKLTFAKFLDWLLQPFQLALAILIPLFLAVLTWYLLYVRRLNKEHVSPYNGARLASEKEKQQGAEEAADKPLSAFEEAELAAAVESSESAEMPDYSEQPAEPIRLEASEQVVFEETAEDTAVVLAFEDEDIDAQLDDEISEEASKELQNEESEFDLGAELENLDDIELDDIDLDKASDQPDSEVADTTKDADATTDKQAEPTEQSDEPSNDHYLEIEALLQEAEAAESDFDNPPFDREAGALDDGAETPAGIIDLARAYIEMSEFDLARAELDKLSQFDDEDAQREAAMLLQQIDDNHS